MRTAAFAITIALAFHAYGQPARGDVAARPHYEEAVRRYNLGEYDAAIRAFRAAYLASSAPSLLFNIAQSYRLKGPGNCGRAAMFYRAYLREQRVIPERPQVERLLATVEECARSEPPVPPSEDPAALVAPPAEPPVVAQPAAPVPAAPTSRANSRPVPWLAIGGGTAAIIAGGVLQVIVRRRFAEFEAECPCEPERWQNWRVAEYGSVGLLAAGAVTTAVAIAWWARRPSDQSMQASLAPVRGGIGVTLQGVFP